MRQERENPKHRDEERIHAWDVEFYGREEADRRAARRRRRQEEAGRAKKALYRLRAEVLQRRHRRAGNLEMSRAFERLEEVARDAVPKRVLQHPLLAATSQAPTRRVPLLRRMRSKSDCRRPYRPDRIGRRLVRAAAKHVHKMPQPEVELRGRQSGQGEEAEAMNTDAMVSPDPVRQSVTSRHGLGVGVSGAEPLRGDKVELVSTRAGGRRVADSMLTCISNDPTHSVRWRPKEPTCP